MKSKRAAESQAASEMPFVYVNMAMTADGKISNASRTESSFGSKADKHRLLVLRSQANAVMAGARTVDLNRITLGPGSKKYRQMRLDQCLHEYNVRIIVSGNGSIDTNAEVFRHRFSPIIVLTTEQIGKARLKHLQSVASLVRICGHTRIDFPETLRWLWREWGIKRLLCEGGGELNGALFRSELVDELNLTICPLILGGRDAPTIADGIDIHELLNSIPLRLKTMRRIADEIFLAYDVQRKLTEANY